MPSPSQIARLAALEARSPTATQPDLSPAEVRDALQSILSDIDGGYDERDPLHRWAWSASDEELASWWRTPGPMPR